LERAWIARGAAGGSVVGVRFSRFRKEDAMSTTSASRARGAVVRLVATVAVSAAAFTASASSAGAAPAPSEPAPTPSAVEPDRTPGDRPTDPGTWCRCFAPDPGEPAGGLRALTTYPEKAHRLLGPWRAAV
jgi:hypothetical protein